jgi:hypothetical protein
MSIVKYDNELREKIEGMNDVPSAFTFNPSAKWQQLENKLQPSPSKKRIVWWYWAAASLFIIFSTLLWLNGGNHTEVATTSNSSKIITPRINKIQQNAIVKQSKTHESISLKTTKTSVNNIAAIADKADTVEVEKMPVLTVSNLMVADIANMVDTVVQKNNTKAVVVNAKPKRKVIHINELGMQLPEPVVITKRDDKHIAPQEEQTTPIETNKNWWLFKPKPTTVNTFTNTSLTDNQ